jgi:hypothetical protein
MRKFALLIALLAAAPIAAPVAGAEKPIRTPRPIPDPSVIPAGLGCAFDVLVDHRPVGGGGAGIFELADGRTVLFGNADLTFTNLDTGKTYIWHSDYRELDTFPDADTALGVFSGKVFSSFFPGDQGPFGEVGENGAIFGFTGKTSFTLDLNTFLYTGFSNQGTVTDICAALTG